MDIEDFLTAEEAEDIAMRVVTLRHLWVDRNDVFYTLGASAYIDDGFVYQSLAVAYNPIIVKYFASLIGKVSERFPDCTTYQDIMLPSFHILGSKCNGHQASIHRDLSYEKLFGKEIDEHLSFTVPISIPECGAGLNIIEGEYVPYEVGKIYMHSGQETHQIAQRGDMADSEFRITLQGHIATVNGVPYLYF